MDFKIGDDFDENGEVKHNEVNNKLKLIFIVGGILLVIIIVTIIVLLVGKDDEKDTKKDLVTKTTLSINDSNSVASYKMITYGYNKGRNDKFISGEDIDIDSFTNNEKYYYALQYMVYSDMQDTGNVDDSGNKIYSIPKDYIDIYMQRVFGEDVEYSTDEVITNTFKFSVNNKNTGTVTYDSNNDIFEIVLTSFNDVIEGRDNGIYYKLNKAYSYSDGKLVLEEKIVYTKEDDNNGSKTLTLYSNIDYSANIGTIDVISDSLINSNNDSLTKNDADYYAKLPSTFNFDDYIDDAGTITYTFKSGEKGYYFVKSEVK